MGIFWGGLNTLAVNPQKSNKQIQIFDLTVKSSKAPKTLMIINIEIDIVLSIFCARATFSMTK